MKRVRVEEIYRCLNLGVAVAGQVKDGDGLWSQGWGWAPRAFSLGYPSPTDAGLACPPCCPCVCHTTRSGLELRWVPVGGYEEVPRAPRRASPLRTSRSRPNPPSIGHPAVVLTSYRSTAERKLLPPLKPPKPTRVRQDVTIFGDPPQPDLDLPSEDGIQTGAGPGGVDLWAVKGQERGRGGLNSNKLQSPTGPGFFASLPAALWC